MLADKLVDRTRSRGATPLLDSELIEMLLSRLYFNFRGLPRGRLTAV